MQRFRVHWVNSKWAAFPSLVQQVSSGLPRLREMMANCPASDSLPFNAIACAPLAGGIVPIAFAFLAFVANGNDSWAQQPPIPNPFRTPQATIRNEDQVAVAESRYADVIRLDKLPSHAEPPVITALSVSRSGELIAAAGDDHAIRIVALTTGKTLSTLSGHSDWVQCVEFSPSGSRLASCGHDGTLRIWSMDATPTILYEKSVGHALFSLVFLNDDQIYVAGFGKNIYRWNATTGEMIVDHACECRDIRSIACSPDRSLIAYGGRDGVLRIRHTHESNDSLPRENIIADRRTSDENSHAPSNTDEWKAPLHFDRIRSIQFSPEGQQITSVGEDRRIVHYDVVKRTAVGQTEVGGGKLMGLCQLETNLFAIAGSDNAIRIFSDIDRRVLVKLVGHDGSVGVLKRTPTRIISGSFDTTIRIWDIARAMSSSDTQGRYVHPVAAQFEDSGAGDLVK